MVQQEVHEHYTSLDFVRYMTNYGSCGTYTVAELLLCHVRVAFEKHSHSIFELLWHLCKPMDTKTMG
jgi:hypothetical protein